MKLDNEFDELARRKLEERAFPFDEAHWVEAQKAIRMKDNGRSRGFWILGAAALFLIGTTAWWLSSGTQDTRPLAATTHQIESNNTSTEENTTTAPRIQESPSSTVNVAGTSMEPVTADAKAPLSARRNTTNTTLPTVPPVLSLHTSIASDAAPRVTSADKPNPVMPSSEPAPEGSVPISAEQDLQAAHVPERTPLHALPPAAEMLDGDVLEITEAATTLAANESLDQGSAPSVTNRGSHTNELPGTSGTMGTAGSTTPTKGDAEAPSLVVAKSTTNVATDSLASDTLDVATTPSDSAATATVLPAAPLLIPARAPWEISALAGIFSSTANYQGGNSNTWNDGVSRVTTSSFGGELMHMGRNFGMGLGIHYSTYAERIAIGEARTNSSTITNYWFLTPVDTTILFITDSMYAGTDSAYYLGESVPVTVNVLTEGADTTTTTSVTRQARTVENRTSYVEIPFLLDAHLVQGRWTLGVRGGPTVGLLTGRTGALPNPANDGYTEFGDQAFREVMLGYTARAYIRYRWNAAWSIGLEPAIRGQLMNSLGEGAIDRHATAFGGMLSLTYRLR